jgi:hypothetical protein
VSKTVLWIVLGGAAFVVVVLAVLTPTVIVGGHDEHARGVRVAAQAPAPAPLPFRQDLLPDLERCLKNHGFGGPNRALPTPDQLRGAFRDCAPRLGG